MLCQVSLATEMYIFQIVSKNIAFEKLIKEKSSAKPM
jgi:hypothetical protein